MIAPMNYTSLGYDYLSKVDDSPTYHSGVDLNFNSGNDDLGDECWACADGQIVFSKDTGKGWGNLIVIYHPEQQIWSRYGHLDKRLVVEGQMAREGSVIGQVGKTGGDWTAHLHFDLITAKIPMWTSYTKGMNKTEVMQFYANPLEYIEKCNKGNEYKKEAKEAEEWHVQHELVTFFKDLNEAPTRGEWYIVNQRFAKKILEWSKQ